MSRIILLDGPIGTELNARGIETPLPHWSASAIEQSPDVLAAIHRDYSMAGATVHTANTFRTRRGTVGECWRDWTTHAVKIAKNAIAPSHQVAGSLAPSADCYRPDLSVGRAAYNDHLEMAAALALAGCDLIFCETFAHGGEAIAAVEAASRTNLPVWIALTAGPSGDLMSPLEMAETAKRCVHAGAAAVLVNCTPASQTNPFVCALGDASLGVPVGAYANAGTIDDKMGWSVDGQPASGLAAELYLRHAKRWVESGATILGGCCGTGPAHVRTMSGWLEEPDSSQGRAPETQK